MNEYIEWETTEQPAPRQTRWRLTVRRYDGHWATEREATPEDLAAAGYVPAADLTAAQQRIAELETRLDEAREGLAKVKAERDEWARQLGEAHTRLQKLADEQFGVGPTEPITALATKIAEGIVEARKRICDLCQPYPDDVVGKTLAELVEMAELECDSEHDEAERLREELARVKAELSARQLRRLTALESRLSKLEARPRPASDYYDTDEPEPHEPGERMDERRGGVTATRIKLSQLTRRPQTAPVIIGREQEPDES